MIEKVESEEVLRFNEQSALIIDIKQYCSDNDSPDDIIELLNKFKKRRDLLATISHEIDQLHVDINKSKKINPLKIPSLLKRKRTKKISTKINTQRNSRNYTSMFKSFFKNIFFGMTGLLILVPFIYTLDIRYGYDNDETLFDVISHDTSIISVLIIFVLLPWSIIGYVSQYSIKRILYSSIFSVIISFISIIIFLALSNSIFIFEVVNNAILVYLYTSFTISLLIVLITRNYIFKKYKLVTLEMP